MLHSSLVSIPILIMLFTSIFLLGKYMSNANEFFVINKFASYTVGMIIYLGITFITFFPLLWFQTNIIYYTVVFFVKEFLLYIFLILKRNTLKDKINFKNIIWIIMSGIIMSLAYNYGIVKYMKINHTSKMGVFQAWDILKNVIATFSQTTINFVNMWIVSIITGTIIFSSITSIISSLTRYYGFWSKFIGLMVSLVLISLTNFSISFEDSLGIYLILFAVLISIRIITFSRRRYGVLFGIISYVVWSIEPNLFLSIAILGLITTIIYTSQKGPKASLFWVQIITPLIMIISLWVYNFSIVLTLILFTTSVIAYIFMLSIGRVKLLAKVDQWFSKYSILIPILLIVVIFLVSIIIVVLHSSTISWLSLTTIHEPIMANWINSKKIIIIQSFLFSSIGIALIALTIYWTYKKSELTKIKLYVIISALSMIVIYNPLVEQMLKSTIIYNQFIYVGSIVVLPIVSVIPATIFNKIKRQKQNITS